MTKGASKLLKEIGKESYVRWFSELGKEDTGIAGGKGANLGEMTKIGMPVPPGFVVLASAYSYFLQETQLEKKIYEILSKLDVDNTSELEEAAEKIHELIINAKMPDEIEEEITENYESLNIDKEVMEKATYDALTILKKAQELAFVAVRSSATAEDTSAASFAGQNETFLNIKGKSQVIEAVKRCWASLFTARSIYYRIKKGFKHEQVLIAVVIQQMIDSDKSGVIFSKNPISQDENVIVEAVYGLGEGIVSGRIQPDHYEVSRKLEILKKGIADKKIAITRNSQGTTETIKLTAEKSKTRVLSDYEIKKLADYSIKLEKHYKKPQDSEFAVESGKLFIVQTRPITTLEKIEKKDKRDFGRELFAGIPASPGIGSGKVKIVHNLKELEKVKKGDVLVTEMTNPDMVVSMQKCCAIVTDEGGMTSHAAIVSREMGIPAVVGTDKATKILKENQEVTVDGYTGKIYSGISEGEKAEIRKIHKTKTKIKVIVDLPDFASRAAETGISQVGLTRIEGIIAESGKHPFYFLNKNIGDYEKIIFSGISKIAEYFDEIWVRTSDIRSDEYKNLEGAPKHSELNPMLGMHGIRFSLKYPEIMKAELMALKKVSNEGKKIGIILPQVINVEEVKKTKEMLKEIDFLCKIGVMVETPAAVQIIDELCEEGIDFISFGTNDLTQYTLAIDRGNEELQDLYNELHPAMKKQISQVISVCKKYDVETSICGQAGSDKEMVKFLVSQGIDSISVNADMAYEISELVSGLEKDLNNYSQDEEDMAKKKEEKIEEKKEEKQEKDEKIEEKKEEFPNIELGFDLFSPSEISEKIEEIDDTGHIEEEAEKIAEKVEEKKKKRAEESKTEVEIEKKSKKESDVLLDIF
ncbi:phosphoenolpyruvate synthase [Candidatus Pacearchaeota archaeon]|nr:phosphoenolpyruvate synthase [Candidatus Pacearchaeota archaeon]